MMTYTHVLFGFIEWTTESDINATSLQCIILSYFPISKCMGDTEIFANKNCKIPYSIFFALNFIPGNSHSSVYFPYHLMDHLNNAIQW